MEKKNEKKEILNKLNHLEKLASQMKEADIDRKNLLDDLDHSKRKLANDLENILDEKSSLPKPENKFNEKSKISFFKKLINKILKKNDRQ